MCVCGGTLEQLCAVTGIPAMLADGKVTLVCTLNKFVLFISPYHKYYKLYMHTDEKRFLCCYVVAMVVARLGFSLRLGL